MLAMDGGGIRGIIPAMMLAELERRAQQPVGALFDLLAGTSTGGILALGLTVPGEPGKPKDRAADLLGLYAHEGRTLCARSVWHRVRSVGGVAEEKYPSEGIEATLARSVGEARMADLGERVAAEGDLLGGEALRTDERVQGDLPDAARLELRRKLARDPVAGRVVINHRKQMDRLALGQRRAFQRGGVCVRTKRLGGRAGSAGWGGGECCRRGGHGGTPLPYARRPRGHARWDGRAASAVHARAETSAPGG